MATNSPYVSLIYQAFAQSSHWSDDFYYCKAFRSSEIIRRSFLMLLESCLLNQGNVPILILGWYYTTKLLFVHVSITFKYMVLVILSFSLYNNCYLLVLFCLCQSWTCSQILLFRFITDMFSDLQLCS